MSVGQSLIDQGILHHVTYDHGFEDAQLFYRWTDENVPEILNVRGEFLVPHIAVVSPQGFTCFICRQKSELPKNLT